LPLTSTRSVRAAPTGYSGEADGFSQQRRITAARDPSSRSAIGLDTLMRPEHASLCQHQADARDANTGPDPFLQRLSTHEPAPIRPHGHGGRAVRVAAELEMEGVERRLARHGSIGLNG